MPAQKNFFLPEYFHYFHLLVKIYTVGSRLAMTNTPLADIGYLIGNSLLSGVPSKLAHLLDVSNPDTRLGK